MVGVGPSDKVGSTCRSVNDQLAVVAWCLLVHLYPNRGEVNGVTLRIKIAEQQLGQVGSRYGI